MIHCDKCEREAPPKDELLRSDWSQSIELSSSGIPMTLICPDCLRLFDLLTNPTEKL